MVTDEKAANAGQRIYLIPQLRADVPQFLQSIKACRWTTKTPDQRTRPSKTRWAIRIASVVLFSLAARYAYWLWYYGPAGTASGMSAAVTHLEISLAVMAASALAFVLSFPITRA